MLISGLFNGVTSVATLAIRIIAAFDETLDFLFLTYYFAFYEIKVKYPIKPHISNFVTRTNVAPTKSTVFFFSPGKVRFCALLGKIE